MGVYGLYSKFVKKKSPDSILDTKPDGKTRGLCFDLNGQLHPLAQKVFMYGKRTWTDEEKIKARKTKSYDDLVIDFLKELNDKLIRTISFFDPYEFVIIAVDGIPPIAKLKQQRVRRLKTYIEETKSKDDFLDSPLADFNSAFISPGTPFMERVHEFLLLFLKENISKIKANTVIYSSFKEEGEGEHKIFERLRQPYDVIKGHFYDPKNFDNVIIWGLDGDLIILGLSSPTNSIFMCREDENSYINIDVMKKDLEISEPNDFCFISNLIGNDFLPKNTIYSTSIPKEVTFAYNAVKEKYLKQSNCCLTYKNNLKVNINFLFDFINELSKYETDLATETYFNQQRQKGTYYKTSSILERAFDKKTNKVDMEKYDKIVLEDLKSLDIYNELTENYEEDIVYNYLNTMFWVYTYYVEGGTSINWNYQYNYLICPSLNYVKKVIKNGAEEFLLKKSKNVFKEEEDTPYYSGGRSPINMGELLLIITPPPILNLAFEKKIFFIDLSKKFFNFLFDNKMKLDYSKIIFYEDDKSKEYEKVIILPYIDVFSLREKIDDIYARNIAEYETKNKEKIKEKRIRDFDKNANLMEINERVLKTSLEDNWEYRYRTPVYEKGDYVFFQRIKKPDHMIPQNLLGKSFKDSVIISIKDLELFNSKMKDMQKMIVKSPEKKFESNIGNPFMKAFLNEKKKQALKSDIVKNGF